MPDPRPATRPRVVEVAFWALALGAVLLVVGGLMAATLSFDTVRGLAEPSVSDDQLHDYLRFHRMVGVFSLVSGVALAFVAGRTRRSGDDRFRRAAIALALTAVVLIVLFSRPAGSNIMVLLGLIPTVVGAVALTRPAAKQWFVSERGANNA